jgi:hypothetical protein
MKNNLILYLKAIIRKWSLWLFLILDIVGVISELIIPNFHLPPYLFVLLAILGFFIAGYQVFKESTESLKAQLARISSEINIEPILKIPEIKIELFEGNEYSYGLEKVISLSEEFDIKRRKEGVVSLTESNKGTYKMPRAWVRINLRINNIGCPMDIVVVNLEWEKEYNIPFSFMTPFLYSMQEEKVVYPIRMISNSKYEGYIKLAFEPRSYRSNAQFASRLKDLKEIKYLTDCKIILEATDDSGTRKEYSLATTISFFPLVSLYVANWETAGQTELIRLSGLN